MERKGWPYVSFDFIRDLIVELLLNLGVLGENK